MRTPTADLITQFLAWFALGGLVLGAALWTPIGFFTAWAVKRKRVTGALQPPVTYAELDALYERLDQLPRRLRHYGAWKVRLDGVYALALPLLAGRKQVVDLGAGIGLLAALLHARSPQTMIRCVEWDAGKAAAAGKLMQGVSQVTVVEGNARIAELGTPDAICLFDVLHYSPVEEQKAWVLRCASALVPGGVLLVRELDPERGRWGLAEKIERRAVKGGWNRGAGVFAWPVSQISAVLRGVGMTVEVRQAGSGLFSANALVVARKGG